MEGMQSCNPRKRTIAGRLWAMSVKNVKVSNQARDPRWSISTEILGVSCVCVTETLSMRFIIVSLSLWFCWCCFHNSFVALCLCLWLSNYKPTIYRWNMNEGRIHTIYLAFFSPLWGHHLSFCIIWYELTSVTRKPTSPAYLHGICISYQAITYVIRRICGQSWGSNNQHFFLKPRVPTKEVAHWYPRDMKELHSLFLPTPQKLYSNLYFLWVTLIIVLDHERACLKLWVTSKV